MHGTRKRNIREAQVPELQALHGYDLTGIKLPNKRQILRNCVNPKLGKHVFDCAYKIRQEVLNFG